MSDTAVVPTTTTTLTPTVPAPTQEAGLSNADFARLRKANEEASAQAVTEKARADQLAAKLAEIETANLTEVEKLRKENSELAPIRDEHGKFASTLERLYSEELAAVPEEKRDAVAGLSGSGDWASRLEALRNAKALITVAPAPAGTVTAPGRAAAPGNAESRPDPSKLTWGQAVAGNKQY